MMVALNLHSLFRPFAHAALSLAIVASLHCTLASGQQMIEAPPHPPETPTEIISGQSRPNTAKPSRTRATQEATRNEAARSEALTTQSPFLNPIAALPPGPYYGKTKRPRKHRLDQDRDGFVSKQELDLENQIRNAAFREADQNRDGKLDGIEMRRYQALVQPKGRGRK